MQRDRSSTYSSVNHEVCGIFKEDILQSHNIAQYDWVKNTTTTTANNNKSNNVLKLTVK